MRDLWAIFSQIDNCLFVMTCMFCVFFVGWVKWVKDCAAHANAKLNTSQYWQVVIAIFLACMTGIIALGLLMAPDNAVKLLELLMIKNLAYDLARQFQGAILWILRLAM